MRLCDTLSIERMAMIKHAWVLLAVAAGAAVGSHASPGTMDTVKKAVILRKPVFVNTAEGDLPSVEEIERKVNRRTA